MNSSVTFVLSLHPTDLRDFEFILTNIDLLHLAGESRVTLKGRTDPDCVCGWQSRGFGLSLGTVR